MGVPHGQISCTPGVDGMSLLKGQMIAPDNWETKLGAALGDGLRYGTLFADSRGLVCILFDKDDNGSCFRTEHSSNVASLVQSAPAAAWAEREAHETHGITFAGHSPLRPLLAHTSDWTIPVTGPDQHEVAVGPVHAGIIESGHFLLHVVGERIYMLDLRLFYKHRGLEQAAVGKTLSEGLRYAQRMCAGCAVANTLAYVMAAESLLQQPHDETTRVVRTILLELERLWNHLNDLSAICAGVGFAAGSMGFAALKEQAQRINQSLFQHRFLFSTIAIGSSPILPERGQAAGAIDEIHKIWEQASIVFGAFERNGSVQDRLTQVGVLSYRMASRLGAVGPAARASGVVRDARTSSPELAYDGFQAAAPRQPAGDVMARTGMRFLELAESCTMLPALLERYQQLPPAAGQSRTRRLPELPRHHVGLGRVESARGETLCCIESDKGKISRLHLKTSSYANWPAVAQAVAGNVMGDFPLINKSFELCYACVDR